MSENEVQETEGAEGVAEEVPTVLVVDTDKSINASLEEIDDPDTLKQMVKKLRGENAKARTKNKDEAAQLAEFQTWKESQMSELEKAQNRAETSEKRIQELARKLIFTEFGLEQDDDVAVEYVTGTEEEMRAKAERYSARVGGKPSGGAPTNDGLVPELFKVPGGKPVTAKKDDGGEFLTFLAHRDLGS